MMTMMMKTEAMLVGTKLKTASVTDRNITVGEHPVEFRDSAKNLGVYLDSTMSMKKQVSSLCRCAYLEIAELAQFVPFSQTRPPHSSFAQGF
jgi:hypothetical protein